MRDLEDEILLVEESGLLQDFDNRCAPGVPRVAAMPCRGGGSGGASCSVMPRCPDGSCAGRRRVEERGLRKGLTGAKSFATDGLSLDPSDMDMVARQQARELKPKQPNWLNVDAMRAKLDAIRRGRLHEMIATIVVIEFFLWPKVTTQMLTLLSCTPLEVDPQGDLSFDEAAQFLTFSADVRCWSAPHLRALLVVGLPGFIGVVGIPLGILLALYVNRNKLADVNVRKAFGFLYMGACCSWSGSLHTGTAPRCSV